MTLPKLYLLEEVADLTGLSARALADGARAGKIQTYRVHGRRYMDEQQVRSYLASTLAAPEPQAQELTGDEAWERFLATRQRRAKRNNRKE